MNNKKCESKGDDGSDSFLDKSGLTLSGLTAFLCVFLFWLFYVFYCILFAIGFVQGRFWGIFFLREFVRCCSVNPCRYVFCAPIGGVWHPSRIIFGRCFDFTENLLIIGGTFARGGPVGA